jgi:hypothetical protein
MFRAVQNFVHKLLTFGGFIKTKALFIFLYSDFAPLFQQDLHRFWRQFSSVKPNLYALSTPLIITTTLNNLKRSIVIL